MKSSLQKAVRPVIAGRHHRCCKPEHRAHNSLFPWHWRAWPRPLVLGRTQPIPPGKNNCLSCEAPSCLSLAHYHGRCACVVLADAELTQVLSIPPAWSQRHSTWPPHALLTLVMGTVILSTISGLPTPEGNDWHVLIPATGLLQRSTTCAHCTALADQMTRTPEYTSRTFHLVALVGLGPQLATPDDNYHAQAS